MSLSTIAVGAIIVLVSALLEINEREMYNEREKAFEDEK